ncbi:MAG: hypothetical protein FJ404_17105 [Verrucomicrobia bacterium]|nr:hypothetical protein [Verrucomicrobiota bacterium]
MGEVLKLNLGCGQNRVPGFVNVDKFGTPDVRCDLEVFPWPWESNSVSQVVLNHVLEHLGESSTTYIGIFKELYRVCVHEAEVQIHVPHPRHDDFLNDPTHVRAVTPEGMALFSQSLNRDWARNGNANSPLGLYHGVDFELTQVHYGLDPVWMDKLQSGRASRDEVMDALRSENNVAKEIQMKLRVVKSSVSMARRAA